MQRIKSDFIADQRKRKLIVFDAIITIICCVILTSPLSFAAEETGPEDHKTFSSEQIPSRGNPKLRSSLNQLLEAYHQYGIVEAKAFAKSHKMLLEDDRVQVTLVTTENGIDEVWDAVVAVGGEYQLDYKNFLQALVPIDQLEVLAQHPEVLIIREPRRATQL